MPGILDRLDQEQRLRDNADVAQTQHSSNWAETFRSTPPTEVLRARVDYVEAFERALRNKQALEARTSVKAQQIQHGQAEHEEWLRQAPMRDAAIAARVAATGATERRRAEQAKLEADQTAALNLGMSKLYGAGLHPTSPEFRRAAVELLGANPYAATDHLDELAAAAGFADRRERDQAVAQAVAEKRAAAQVESRLMHLERQRNRKGLDESQRQYFDAEIAKVQAARGGAAVPSAPADGLSDRDRMALDWAKANPDDPRAAAILKKHEAK